MQLCICRSASLCLLALLFGLGCGSKSDTSLTTQVGNSGDSSKPPLLVPDESYPIPNVAPVELLDYINRLAERKLRGETEEEYRADMKSLTKSRLIAADRILLSPDVDSGLVEAGIIAKLDALRTLAQLDPDELGAYYQPFVQGIIEGDNARLSLVGRISCFEHEMDNFGSGQTDNPDKIIGLVREILADPNSGYREFLVTQHAGVPLHSRGFPEKATELLQLVGNHFSDDQDEKLAEEAKTLLVRTAFRSKVFDALDGGKEEVSDLLKAVNELLSKKDQLNLDVLDTTQNAGQMLEFTGNFDAARRVFTAVKKAFSDHDKLAEQANRSADYALKRLDLIGESVELAGVHIDGTPFDWEDHKGKVVLIDFWATWSPPWRESLSNLKSAYEKYHADGFEIVGVNLDEDRKSMYDFLQSKPIPWPLLIDETGGGFGNPNAVRYGVEAVPFVVLVGRDGKVANIHLRGPELDRRIQELVSSPSSQNARESDSSKKYR